VESVITHQMPERRLLVYTGNLTCCCASTSSHIPLGHGHGSSPRPFGSREVNTLPAGQPLKALTETERTVAFCSPSTIVLFERKKDSALVLLEAQETGC
jgi:hypothetical protein